MKYDLIVITAANKAQAEGYRVQLRGRKGFLVVPDPGDRRVGSLGATVNVLRKLRRREGLQRVLICHSGGDAKRTPAYAANGKAFVPMPDGRPLLDHIISEMEKLPAAKGVTVCCGDVIPYMDMAAIRFAPRGVTGVAYPDGPWQARRHGVYITSSTLSTRAARGSAPTISTSSTSSTLSTPSTLSTLSTRAAQGSAPTISTSSTFSTLSTLSTSSTRAARGSAPTISTFSLVTSFLQKPQVTRGRFLIDTGILHFDWETAAKMTKLPVAGDIYEEFPKLLLEGFAPFRVSVASSCTFFHIGSSRELLKLLGKKGTSVLPRGVARGRILVDAVRAPIVRLAGDNIVTNVPAAYGEISLEKGECLTSLPLKGDDGAWYHLRYRVDDTFKEDGLWDRHGLGEKMRRVDHRRLIALKK